MKKLKVTKETVGKIVNTGCKAVLYGLAIVLPYATEKNMTAMKYYIGTANYSDAVGVIMSSSMFSSDKNKVIEILKRDENPEYYKSVIQVVNSTMFSGDKIKAIKMLSEN